MSEHKGHEQHENEHIGDMVDHISNLPDCILHYILSFMHTQAVVKTSILSTRWKNLWISVPNIDLYDDLLCAREVNGWRRPEVTSFMNFVERVLRFRGASNIEKFCLYCIGHGYDESQLQKSQIHSWISDAIMHNVKELDLGILGEDPSVIPRSMFDSTLLVTLKIRTYCVSVLPSHVSFPCLKTLHLYFVRLPNDDYIEKLLSGCPVVEELVLSECEWMNFMNIVISSSTLKSLTIDDLREFPGYDGCCTIKIDAENLTYFEYNGFLTNKILLKNVSSLVKACIHISTIYKRQKEIACRGVDLLKQLQYVVSLRLSNCTIESLRFADNMLVRFSVFPNLSHLMLTTEIGNYDFGAVMDLLYFCPVLRSIYVSEGFKHCLRLGEHDPIWLLPPMCLSNCLKTWTFKNFHATNSEICFLKCIMKYAHVLERMDIWWSKTQLPDLKKQTQIEVKKELETIKRSSTTCVIKFS